MPRPRDLTIVTTRERAEALIRHLESGYLGYVKDDGKVRELIADVEHALLKQKADV